jgi:hypothetical protein
MQYRVLSLLFAVLMVGCCFVHGQSGEASSHGTHAGASAVPGLELPNASALLDLLASPVRSSTQAAQPTLLLFTDASAQDTTMDDAIRATVRQLAADIPPSVLRVHAFTVPAVVTERRLVDVLLNGIASRLPALVLFHGNVQKAQVVPGSFIAGVPLSPPLAYPKLDQLRGVNYMELRTWVLSEMPARYVDPITFHLIPSLQFVFHPSETLDTLRLVRQAVGGEGEEGSSGSRATLPGAVSMAYVRLTTHGSEDVVAALSSLATQAGNSVLTLVTESVEVAAGWGLTQEHTMATAPWTAVEAAYHLSEGNISIDHAATVIVQNVTAPQLIGTVAETVEATAASSLWQAAASTTAAAQKAQLRAWSRAMESFRTISPLRKLDSAAHVVHELASLQQAIKIVFVLRESDEMWFHHHLEVAVRLASRLQQTSVLYNATTLQANAKTPSRVVRSWTPPVRMEVFWVDAEQLPEVADSFFVAQVPSVLVLAPLQSRFQEVTEGEGEEEAQSSAAGLRSRDPFIGVHTVNRHDLLTVAFTGDATAAVDPPTGKSALPLFPTDSDALVRFLASGGFLGALPFALRPLRLSQLRASLLTDAHSNAGTVTSSPLSTLPNRHYLQLDHRYYPTRLSEEPMAGPAYVRQILNGSSPLPVMTEAQRQATRTPTRNPQRVNGSEDDAKAAAAAANKAAWEAELARRRRDREARMQRKAAEDAAVRAKEKAAFQQSVEEAFRAEAASADETSDGVSAGVRPLEGMLVRRPSRDIALTETTDGAVDSTSPSSPRSASVSRAISEEPEDAEDAAQRVRRRRLYAEYKAWQQDRARMVESCVSVMPGKGLSLRFMWS